MPKDVIDLPVIGRAATLRSVDEEARTVEVVWTTGAQVRRYSWARDEEFDEELVVDPSALRLERLNSGAPFLEAHRAYSLGAVLGVVVEGSVRIEAGRGYATVRFSQRAEVEPVWRDIVAGIIRHVSVGYRVHKFERIARADRGDGGSRALYRAVDWEPMEISAVAIGADPGAHIRSEGPEALAPCVVIRRNDHAATAAITEEAEMPKDKDIAGGAVDDKRTELQPPTTPPAKAAEAGSGQRGDPPAVDQSAGDMQAAARSAILDALASNDPAGRVCERVPAQARGTGERDVAIRAWQRVRREWRWRGRSIIPGEKR